MWECSFSQLVSTKDRLIQFKIVCIYFNPIHLHQMYPFVSASCWGCSSPSADFIHIFWQCHQIKIFRVDVIKFILSVTTIQVLLEVEVCLLGLVDPLAPSRAYITSLLCMQSYYTWVEILLSTIA